jgi:hypothetical protein
VAERIARSFDYHKLRPVPTPGSALRSANSCAGPKYVALFGRRALDPTESSTRVFRVLLRPHSRASVPSTMGGWGFWNGFGYDQTRAKSTNSTRFKSPPVHQKQDLKEVMSQLRDVPWRDINSRGSRFRFLPVVHIESGFAAHATRAIRSRCASHTMCANSGLSDGITSLAKRSILPRHFAFGISPKCVRARNNPKPKPREYAAMRSRTVLTLPTMQ